MMRMTCAASRRLRESAAWHSRLRAAQRFDRSMEPRRHHLPRGHRQAAVPVVRRTPQQGGHVSWLRLVVYLVTRQTGDVKHFYVLSHFTFLTYLFLTLTDGRTPDRYITLFTRRSQCNNGTNRPESKTTLCFVNVARWRHRGRSLPSPTAFCSQSGVAATFNSCWVFWWWLCCKFVTNLKLYCGIFLTVSG